MEYRRSFVPGGTYFFTVVLEKRTSTLLVDHVDRLRQSFRQVIEAHPFSLTAAVILPDHLHCIWMLPPQDCNYPLRWRQIKAGFTRRLPRVDIRSPSQISRRERGIWQRRYWEHRIRDADDLRRHLDYIHYNPVKHGLAASAKEWPYSSFHRYVERGIYALDWGAEPGLMEAGE